MIPDLDGVIASCIDRAKGDARQTDDLIAALTAGLSLAIALSADGDPQVASDECEIATTLLFKTVAANASAMSGHMRGAA